MEEGDLGKYSQLTCVTDTGVVNFDADLVGLGRGDFDILDAQGLTGLPGDGSLASDDLVVWPLDQRNARLTFNGSLGERKATPQCEAEQGS